jgi:hypothetical protein
VVGGKREMCPEGSVSGASLVGWRWEEDWVEA